MLLGLRRELVHDLTAALLLHAKREDVLRVTGPCRAQGSRCRDRAVLVRDWSNARSSRQVPGSSVHSIRWVQGRDALDVVACQKPEPDYLATVGATPGSIERRIDLPKRTKDVVWDPEHRRALVVGHEWIARMDSTGGATGRREIAGAVSLETSPDGRWYALAHGNGFRVGPTEDLALGVELAMRYASNPAFSADSRRAALATWKAGEVWQMDRLASSVAARDRG